jgi:hypothetical protein
MNSIKHSTYHRVLRSSIVVTACVFAFASGAVVPDTRVLTLSTERYIANVVGMTASVEPTEINTLSGELAKRSDELDRREREIDARARSDAFSNSSTLYVLTAILALQLVLIVTNYVLDFRRARAERRVLVSQVS